ncbi:MAG: MFS transporter [Alphaproteobacteria bacterium]|nr:MFS transporter [Alphaproteobacteria bacterium]
MVSLRFLRANARLIGFGFALCFLSSVGQTYFIALFGGEIRAAFGLSHGGFGTVYMAGTLASAATLMLLGRLVDVWPPGRTALLTLGGLAAVAAGMGFVADPVTLAAAIFGLRLMGQGMAVHIGVTAMARYFVAERGRALSIASLGQAMGAALSPPYVVALLALVSWREAWWVTAALVLLALPVAVGLMRGQPAPMSLTGRGGDNPPVAGHRLGQVLRDPGLWLRLPVLLTPAFLSTGYVFHQVHIAHAKAWPIELVAASFTAYAIAQVAGLMTAGQLVDRFSARRLVPLFLAPLGLCSVVLALAEAYWLVPVYLALMGFGSGLGSVIQGALWAELYGARHLGAIRSFGAALMVFSSGLAPMVMGLAFDAGTGIAAVALAGAVWCVLASLVASLAQRPAGRGEASALD